MTGATVVAVFGLSGVGKSWMISRYAAQIPVLHVQASQLLRDAKASLLGQMVTSEELRKGAVLDNQALLVEAFARIRERAVQTIVFDGHCVVDSGERLLEIPPEVISALRVSKLVFIEGSASSIVERRRNDLSRVRPDRSEAEIADHHTRARGVCEGYSRSLRLPLTIVAAGDEQAFSDALAKSFEIAAPDG